MVVHKHAAARRVYRPRRPVAPVVTVRVHPAAWETALQLAGGDRHRLRVCDSRTVLVVNR
jgi:hypothetical protein